VRSRAEAPCREFSKTRVLVPGTEVVMAAEPAPTSEPGGMTTEEVPRAAERWAAKAVICWAVDTPRLAKAAAALLSVALAPVKSPREMTEEVVSDVETVVGAKTHKSFAGRVFARSAVGTALVTLPPCRTQPGVRKSTLKIVDTAFTAPTVSQEKVKSTGEVVVSAGEAMLMVSSPVAELKLEVTAEEQPEQVTRGEMEESVIRAVSESVIAPPANTPLVVDTPKLSLRVAEDAVLST